MNDYIPVSDEPSDCNKGQIRPTRRCKLDASLLKAEFMTYHKRDNCFNFIRLIAALQVFFGHASEHLFVPMPSGVKEIWWAFRGVPIFFILSGFLIWNSLERQTSFFTYCKKRLLRLYPELWGGVILNAVIILVIYKEQISTIPFFLFQCTQATVLQFWTPDCLRGYGCGTPNGALWTVGVMVQCYIVIYFLHRVLHNKRGIGFLLVILAGMAVNIGTIPLKGILPEIIYKLFTQTFFPYLWLFVVGAMLCEYFGKIIVILKKYWGLCLAILLAVSISGIEDGIGLYGCVQSLMLGFIVIGFGYSVKIPIKHDISYGIFIYHMVVINAMVQFGVYGNWYHIVIALIGTTILAVLSYGTIGYISRRAKRQV